MAIRPEASTSRAGALTDAAAEALRERANWVQLAKFSVVGASGYAVNLGVFAILVHLVGLHYLPAAVCSFLVAASNNYTWNRVWTFRHARGHLVFQGMRFLTVSTIALSANLLFLAALVGLGLPKVPAQAVASALVTPWNFVAYKLWSFRRPRAAA